jgi:hypothetical protein
LLISIPKQSPKNADEPDSEYKSERNVNITSSQPKYEVDSFVIKEVDSIWCIGVIEAVQFCQSFLYLVHFYEKDVFSFITEDDVEELVFQEDEWIVKKTEMVFVKVGRTDLEAVIDSLGRL